MDFSSLTGIAWIDVMIAYLKTKPSAETLVSMLGEARNSLKATNIEIKPKNPAVDSILLEGGKVIVINLKPKEFGLTEKALEDQFGKGVDASNADEKITIYKSSEIEFKSATNLSRIPESGYIDELDFEL